MSDYQPVPVEAARIIGRQYAKNIVVIVSVDQAHQLTHFTSWGDSPADKDIAAALADRLCTATGHELSQQTSFEDFRGSEAAKNAADVATLAEACRRAVEAPTAHISRALKQQLQAALDKITWRAK